MPPAEQALATAQRDQGPVGAHRAVLRVNRLVPDLVRVPNDEIVPVRHLHLRQGLGVHHLVLADDLVEREDVGGERVKLVVGQRFRDREGHRPAHDVACRNRIPNVRPTDQHIATLFTPAAS